MLPIFQPFLADADAAHLLRTSRSTAFALLRGYTFSSHTFQPTSLVSLRRLRDLCLRYSLRVTQLGLPAEMKELPFDPGPSHLSSIPASVTALSLGSPYSGRVEERWAAFRAAAVDWGHRDECQLPDVTLPTQEASFAQRRDGTTLVHRLSPRGFLAPTATLDSPLHPGLLPDGLRVLRFNSGYNQPLQPGSLPPNLTSVLFNRHF